MRYFCNLCFYILRKKDDNVIKKLEVQDYVFEYNGEDLKGAELKCTFKNKDKDEYEQMTFEISAQDKEKQEYSLVFDLVNISLDKLTDKLTKVNSHLLSSAYFYKPDDSIPLMDILTEEHSNLYENPANCFMAKIDDRYFLKLSIPEEKIFLWFYFLVV